MVTLGVNTSSHSADAFDNLDQGDPTKLAR